MSKQDWLQEVGQNVMRQVGVDSDDVAIWAEATKAINQKFEDAIGDIESLEGLTGTIRTAYSNKNILRTEARKRWYSQGGERQ
jgi:hypothetical protein